VLAGTADPDALAAGLCRVFGDAYSEEGKVSVTYSTGGHAREGATILLAETAVDAASRAISIAEAYAQSR